MLGSPKRDRRSVRRDAATAEILDAAWVLVREHGLAGLSLRDLAHRVGMQAPSLYSYFSSKNAIYDAMFAQAAQQYLHEQSGSRMTGDALTDLKAQMRAFVGFCVDDVPRYQLLFQRTIPGFEPSAESFALAVTALEEVRLRLASMGFTEPRDLDLLTAVGTGLTDQQISNDPGGDRWLSLVDEAMEMFYEHVSRRTTDRRTTDGGRP